MRLRATLVAAGRPGLPVVGPPECYRRVVPAPRRYVTDAIVLSRFDLGEADRVLTLITPQHGKLKAIAKGIRRPTSRLGGSLEPFAELNIALARGRTFDVVTEVRVGHAWLRLRDNLESAATAWYLAELADRSLEERHEAEPLYDLLRRAYELLDAGMAPGRVARWYELHLADELGQRPEVDRCVECDRMLEPTETYRWVPPLGGVVCSRCPGRPRTGPHSRSMRSSCSRPTSAWISRRWPPFACPRRRSARRRPPCATSCASRWSGIRARLPSSTRCGPARRTRRTTRQHHEEVVVIFASGSDADRHALERLATDPIGWLATVTPDGQPQTFPIWFLWEDGEITIYSDHRAKRNQNIAANPRVSLHLNDNGRGGDVVIVEGEARIDPDGPAVMDNPAYLRKYGDWIRDFISSPEEMHAVYNVVVRIAPTRGRAFGA